MRSVRLDSGLDARLVKAAAVRGETVSEFLRQAAAERVEATLTEPANDDLQDLIGVIRSDGGRARRTGAAFAEGLAADHVQGRARR